jgi:hypothetical protein
LLWPLNSCSSPDSKRPTSGTCKRSDASIAS